MGRGRRAHGRTASDGAAVGAPVPPGVDLLRVRPASALELRRAGWETASPGVCWGASVPAARALVPGAEPQAGCHAGPGDGLSRPLRRPADEFLARQRDEGTAGREVLVH